MLLNLLKKYNLLSMELKKLTEDLKNGSDHSTLEGERECNRRKNRYKDILPYDSTRVELQSFPGIPGSDYINANYIRGASGSRTYIASQGPLPHTVNDFWRMVVECDVQVIVMASNETEGGKHKCECYWVDTPGVEKQFGNVQVTFVKSRYVCPDFLVRTFKISYPSPKSQTEERTICQFHYVLWPDHGVPDTVRPLIDMVRLVRDCQSSETLPVLVHCSAGCGRTGTICAIDHVWGLLRTGRLACNLDLFSIVKDMRKQRVAMVQTREQYMLLYQAVKELFKDRLKLIDAHPYENVATDGKPLSLKVNQNDYEELFMSCEKQDKSLKAAPNTPTGSLTRSSDVSVKDPIRKCASTSSLNAGFQSSTQTKVQSVVFPSSDSSTSLSDLKQLTLEAKLSPKVYPTCDVRLKRAHPSKMEKDAENFAQMAKQKLIKFPPTTPPRASVCLSPTSVRKVDSVDGGHKRTEIVRRPSISKLKELFEKPTAPPQPTKLSRSASSVTSRPSLSIPVIPDSMSLKYKRKNTYGSQENIAHSIRICPPPPPPHNTTSPLRLERSSTSLALTPCRLPSKETNSPVDDRPVLPIKKSKSFRWTRTDGEYRPSAKGTVEISDEADGRCKNKSVDRYKLSVYQEPADKPVIPPKKNIGERCKNFKLVPLQTPSLHYQPNFRTSPNESRCHSSQYAVKSPPSYRDVACEPKDSNKSLVSCSSDFFKNNECLKYTVPLPSKRNERDKHDYANISYESPAVSPRCQDGRSANYSKSKCEDVDFGESSNINDVLETVNYELVSAECRPKNTDAEFYMNKDLDVIAKQVYRDCQEYLMGSISKNPSTSIEACLPSTGSSSPNSESDLVLNPKDLEQVRSKVTVPPQGLRNRERRNSYRQAVNAPNRILKGASPHKPGSQYERIWLSGSAKGPPRTRLSNPQDFESNLDQQMNISSKEARYKDKLEKLNNIMSSLEQKQLPDLSEEELSSKHSGSTCSLPSRSGQSHSSVEPIYANIDMARPPCQYTPISPYGTLATTTSNPYKPRQSKEMTYVDQPSHYTNTLPVRSAPPSETKPLSRRTLDKSAPDSHHFDRPTNATLMSSRSTRPVSSGSKNKLKNLHVKNVPPKNHRSSRSKGPTVPDGTSVRLRHTLRKAEAPRAPPRIKRHSFLGFEHPLDRSNGPIPPVRNTSDVSISKPSTRTKQNVRVPQGNHSSPLEHVPLRHSVSSPYLTPPPPKPVPPSYHLQMHSPNGNRPHSKRVPHRDSIVTTDSSEGEEGILVKINAPKALSKVNGSEERPIKNPSHIAQERRNREDAMRVSDDSCESPKPLTKALDKLRIGSKNVAANFKSYLKGQQEESPPLRKSVTSTHVQSIGQVVDHCTYPVNVARKPAGPRDMPHMEGKKKKTKAKEQYL